MSNLKYIDYTVDATGATYGIANIQQILGIIVLILSILSFLSKVAYSIYVKIKDKKYDEISTELDKAKSELEEANKVIEIMKEKSDDNS